jgi:hypothetical protein
VESIRVTHVVAEVEGVAKRFGEVGALAASTLGSRGLPTRPGSWRAGQAASIRRVARLARESQAPAPVGLLGVESRCGTATVRRDAARQSVAPPEILRGVAVAFMLIDHGGGPVEPGLELLAVRAFGGHGVSSTKVTYTYIRRSGIETSRQSGTHRWAGDVCGDGASRCRSIGLVPRAASVSRSVTKVFEQATIALPDGELSCISADVPLPADEPLTTARALLVGSRA